MKICGNCKNFLCDSCLGEGYCTDTYENKQFVTVSESCTGFIDKSIGHKIILEGIDGCGKSTLAQKIKDENPQMNYKIVHCTRKTPNNLEFFINLLDSPDNIIFDRFHIGQFVYQTSEQRIKNKWLRLSDLEIIENKIYFDGHEVIFVDTDLDTCLVNCLKDSEDSYYNIDYIKNLYDNYQYFFNNISQIDHTVYHNEFNVSGVKDESKCKYDDLPKVVAVDFDGCLVVGAKFPEIGEVNRNLKYELFEGKYKDWKKILWSSRTGDSLNKAIQFCVDNDMPFDAYNTNIDEVKNMTGGDTRKVYADIYIDDKALNSNEFNVLNFD